LEIPSIGSINVHPSLLPKYRGPAPIQWAIWNGERQTGITIIKMSEKMDEGDILYQERFGIGTTEDAQVLSEKLSERTAGILPDFLSSIEKNGLPAGVPQCKEEVTYAPMVTKEMGRILWAVDEDRIVRQVRALVTWPTAYTFIEGKLLKVFSVIHGHRTEEAEPGTVLEILPDGLLVAALSGSVLLQGVQLENRRRMAAAEFARGYRGIIGKKMA
jgi:methionyl-tRNA formyltransferase